MGQMGQGMSRGLYFFYEEGNENHQLGKGVFVRHTIISAVKRINFINDRMS